MSYWAAGCDFSPADSSEPSRPPCVPITEGIQPFMVNDEQHYVQYDLDPAHVILESENIDGLTFQDMGTKSASAWAHDCGKGRVVFTAVGHNMHAMWNPQYRELQKRSVRWLLRQI